MGKVNDATQYPYSPIGLLEITLDDGNTGWGTGTLIDNTHILTCGHNLLYNGRYATSATFYPHYNAGQRPQKQNGLAVGAGFLPTPFTRNDKSWDIGVYRLSKPQNVVTQFMSPIVVTEDPSKLMKIAGYPGDHHYEMWEDQEPWVGVNIEHHVFAYSHETSAGSSGSPVFRLEGIYGVHRGLIPGNEDKVGVLITEVTNEFIQVSLRTHPTAFITLLGN